MGVGSANNNPSVKVISSSWAEHKTAPAKGKKGRFKRASVSEVSAKPQHKQAPKGNEKRLNDRQIRVATEGLSQAQKLELAVTHLKAASSEVQSAAKKKGATPASIESLIRQHANNANEVVDLFNELPNKTRNKPAVAKAFENLLMTVRVRGPAPKTPEEAEQSAAPPQTQADTARKTSHRMAPRVDHSVILKQLAQQQPDKADDLQRLSDYMNELAQYMKGYTSEAKTNALMTFLGKECEGHLQAGWNIDQYMDLCYQSVNVAVESKIILPPIVMFDAYKRL